MRFSFPLVITLPISLATAENDSFGIDETLMIPPSEPPEIFACFNDLDIDCLRQPDALAFNQSGCLDRFEDEFYPFSNNDCMACIYFNYLESIIPEYYDDLFFDDWYGPSDPCFPPPSLPTVGCDSDDFAQLENSLANNDTVGEFMTTVSNQCYACLVPTLSDALEQDPLLFWALVLVRLDVVNPEFFNGIIVGNYTYSVLEELTNSSLSEAFEFFKSENLTEYCFAGFPLTSSPTASPTSAAGVLQAGASVVATFVWLVALAMED